MKKFKVSSLTKQYEMEEKLATQVVLGHSSRKRRELIRRGGHTLQNLLRSIYTLDVVVIAEDQRSTLWIRTYSANRG